jgi:transcriptional regulator with XRE-family HTH domain
MLRYPRRMPPQYSSRLPKCPPKIPNTIRRYRLLVGLTQLEVAGRLGTRLATVSSWERGQTCPAGPMLLRLAKVLDTLAEALYPQFYLLFREKTTTPSA